MSAGTTPESETLQIDVHGLPTAYRRAGEGEPVVYMHGVLGGASRSWGGLHERLAGRFDLIAPQHPGFGETPRPEWLDDFLDVSLHYDELLDRLGLESVHLVGHSLGAWIAAEFAVVYPERVRSLTLIAPLGLRVIGHPPADIFRITPSEAPGLLFDDDETVELPDVVDVDAAVSEYDDLTSAARLMWNPRYDLKLDRRLERLRAPGMAIAAAEDRILPRAHAERWAELLPQGRLEVVAGATEVGHMVVDQEPEAVAGLIAENVARGSSA